jgi:glycine hydroxymethyltransferase
MHVIAAKAVAFHEAMQPEFVSYQKAVLRNAKTMASELGRSGLRLVSGGTDTHLLLVDLSPIGITGAAAEKALDAVGITVNKNVIPFDPRSPLVTSGIRLGTPAVTTRGFGDKEMKQIAGLIVKVLFKLDDDTVCRQVRQQVNEICEKFPVPGITR